MNNDNITIQQRSQNFAVRIIKAYTKINDQDHFNSAAAILSKQFLRSGTSIGANISEAIYAQSNADFISKYSIALKEASEVLYWMQIMIKSEIATEKQFALLIEEVERIIRILTAIINKLKLKGRK